MSCQFAQERLSPLLDEHISVDEREIVLAHLDSCWDCKMQFESLRELRSGLQKMQQPAIPAALRAKLQIVASHERARTLSRLTFKARMEHLSWSLHMMFENIMRPFGLPVASGLISAMALFALLTPSLSIARPGGVDTNTPVATYPQLEETGDGGDYPEVEDADSFGSNYEMVVELKIKPTGSVWDWKVTQGNRELSLGELTPDLKQMILTAHFAPATIFGKPTYGVVRFLYKHAYIIKG
jgi:hypothetical protein